MIPDDTSRRARGTRDLPPATSELPATAIAPQPPARSHGPGAPHTPAATVPDDGSLSASAGPVRPHPDAAPDPAHPPTPVPASAPAPIIPDAPSAPHDQDQDHGDDELDPCVLQRALTLLSERGYGPARNRGAGTSSLILDGVTLSSLVELGESRGATGIRRRLLRGFPLSDIPAYPFLIVFKDRSAALVEQVSPAPDGSATTFLIREERDDGTAADAPLSMDWDDLEALWEGDALFYL